MTGAYVRIRRGEKWTNEEIDQLTDSELESLARTGPMEDGWIWAKFLARWIRDNVTEELPKGVGGEWGGVGKA